MSDRPESLGAALAELQQHLPRIVKGTEGQSGPRRYKYADLADISAELLPLLGQLGLSFTGAPTLIEMGGEIKFVLRCRLWHAPTGESDVAFYPLGTGNPQQLGSAISYARRYALNAMTGLAPDDEAEDDGQAAEQAARAQRNAAPEVRADGSATEAELTRMNRGHEPGTWRSTSTADNDGWYDQPIPALAPEDVPGTSNKSQRQGIYIALGRRGIKDHKAAIERLTGRDITEPADMTYNEAIMVKARVDSWDGRTEELLTPFVAHYAKVAADDGMAEDA